jgi:hypothetical protein
MFILQHFYISFFFCSNNRSNIFTFFIQENLDNIKKNQFQNIMTWVRCRSGTILTGDIDVTGKDGGVVCDG